VPNDSAQHAAQLMKELDIGAVPICDDTQKAVGILTDRDLVLRVVAVGRDPEATPVGQMMTGELFTCRQGTVWSRRLRRWSANRSGVFRLSPQTVG
jgi:CBS domain-containing protein